MLHPVVTTGSRVKIMALKNSVFSRGSLAKRCGINSETIRYYEIIKLMPDPVRSEGGHRIYNESHLKRLSFIKRCRELGFTLKEIRGLLDLVDGGNYTCAEVRDRTSLHLNNMKQKIRDLQKMQRTLKKMVSQCDGGLVPECPIIDMLFS